MNKIKEILKEKNGFISCLGGLAGIIILITTIIGFFSETKSISGLIILLIASVAVIGGAVVYNLFNPKMGNLALATGSVIGLIGFRMVSSVNGYGLLCTWLICLLVCFIASVKLFVNFEKVDEPNWKKRVNILPIILNVITIAFIIALIVSLVPTGGAISIIVCTILIAVILTKEILKIFAQIPNAGYLILLMPFFTIMGIVPSDVALSDSAAIILTILYILSFVLVIAELKLADKKSEETNERVQ